MSATMRVQTITVLLPGPVQVAQGDRVEVEDVSALSSFTCTVVAADEPVSARLSYPETGRGSTPGPWRWPEAGP